MNKNKWVYYSLERAKETAWFVNGIKATYTKIFWLDRLIFKLVYWWKFTRLEKTMRGSNE